MSNTVRVSVDVGGSQMELLVSVTHFDLQHDDDLNPTTLSFSGEVLPEQRTPIERIRVSPSHKVRRHALGTSWEAAYSQTPEKSRRMYLAIYRLLSRLGPMTDYELRDAMKERNFSHSWSGVSARRNDLVQAGWVRATGEKRLSPNGAPAFIWEAVPEKIGE